MNPSPHAQAKPFSLINPDGLYDPAPNGYSHLAAIGPNARLLLVAGQGGENARGELVPDFVGQMRQAFRNLETAMAAAGAKLDDIAKLTVLIVGHNEDRLKAFGAELDRVWPKAAMKPACTLIPVPRLALDGMLFEVEATAVVR
ncbi:RidA family protein [Pseudorhodoplanes sp.]|uniref:RidA family protein n=1 Tax=Pseudorhodoplanes sp. TaxID=1934341 RepID=UPI00391873A6